MNPVVLETFLQVYIHFPSAMPPPLVQCLTAIDGAQQLLAGTPVATTRWIKDAKGSIMGHQDIHTYMQVCMLKTMEAFKGIWLTDSTWTYKKKLWSWTSFFLWTANFSHFSLLSFRDTLSRSTWFNVFLRKNPWQPTLLPWKLTWNKQMEVWFKWFSFSFQGDQISFKMLVDSGFFSTHLQGYHRSCSLRRNLHDEVPNQHPRSSNPWRSPSRGSEPAKNGSKHGWPSCVFFLFGFLFQDYFPKGLGSIGDESSVGFLIIW